MRKPLLFFTGIQSFHLWGIFWLISFFLAITPSDLKAQLPPLGCDPQISGLDYVCVGEQTSYSDVGITFPPFPLTAYQWTLSGGGVISSGSNTPSVVVRWGNTPGVYTLVLTTSVSNVCTESDTLFITVADDTAPQITCNDTVQVSLNQNCEAEILPDMVLEGSYMSNDAFRVELRDKNRVLLPDAMVNSAYVGQFLEARVVHICSGNSCWGRVFVEDKLPPMLTCDTYELNCDDPTDPQLAGPVFFPLKPGFLILDQTGPREYLVAGADACGLVTLKYDDRVENFTCPPAREFIQVIYRDWVATDEYGTQGACTDTLFVRTGNLDNVIPPPNFDDIDQPVLNCTDTFKLDAKGNPHPDVTGYPGGDALCPNIDYEYFDYRLGVCEGSYKIVREWIVADWCAGTSRVFDQVIKVLDTEIFVTCPPLKTISTNPFTCVGETDIEPPTVLNDCSSWDYIVLTKKFEPGVPPSAINATDDNVIRKADGTYRVFDLPAGLNWIIYVVEDACGNVQECASEILVEEKSKPIPVCDEHTVVTLSNNGTAKVFAESLDDGSYDNCGIDRFEVRRMDEGDCQPGVYDSTEFRGYVEFCCADIANNPIMVVLRVYDKSENFNECMTFIEVQDENPPTVVCLPNLVVNCGIDISDLSIFGNYVENETDRENIIINNRVVGKDGLAQDECGVQTDTIITYNLTSCGTGTIIRRFAFSDGFHNDVICRQIITIRNQSPFPGDSIIWPNDTVVLGCLGDLDPAITGMPSWDDSNYCADLDATYKDQIFNIVEQACYKVLRKWTVFDHCEVNGRIRTFERTQVIKVANNQAPTFTSSCSNRSFSGSGTNCSGYAELVATAEDDCTPSDDLVWSYRIDADNDGTFDFFGSGNDASGDYPGGTHRISFTVEDQCGNENTCTFLFTIRDAKKPTPYCRTGIITVVMPMSGEVAVWASDLNAGSFDNCTAPEDLIFSFSSNRNNTSRVYRCSDIPNGIEETFEVQIWVTDEAGNQDFCTTKIIIQDNAGDACPDAQTGTSAIIAGDVITPLSESVENVMVKIQDATQQMNKEHMTLGDGHFAFNGLPMYQDYILKAQRNDNPLNGVTTRDLIAIQRHLLGKEEFNSPYQYIAADANASQSVSAKDIIELRKLILGIYKELPNSESWRFVKADQQFADPTHPFPFEENISFVKLEKDQMASDMVAVKIGDINNDARSNQLVGTEVRTKTGDLYLLTKESAFVSGEHLSITLASEQLDKVEGFQFALAFNTNLLEFDAFQDENNSIGEGNAGLNDVQNGVIRFSWNAADENEVLQSDKLFTLRFIAKKNGNISNAIFIEKTAMPSEAYGYDGQELNVKLQFRSGNQSLNNTGFALLQNMPNPFEQSTTIPFSLPYAGEAVLRIFDVTGAEIFRVAGEFDAGLNQITIYKDDLNMRGILYYQLNSESHTATRKMILIE